MGRVWAIFQVFGRVERPLQWPQQHNGQVVTAYPRTEWEKSAQFGDIAVRARAIVTSFREITNRPMFRHA